MAKKLYRIKPNKIAVAHEFKEFFRHATFPLEWMPKNYRKYCISVSDLNKERAKKESKE